MFKLKTVNGENNITGKRLTAIRHQKGISQRQLAKNLQLLGYDVDPVSYTHLDVYKRQMYVISNCGCSEV